MRKRTSESYLVFSKARKKGCFFDAIVKVQNIEFATHKVILSSCSPYFLALFTRWSLPHKKVYETPNLSPYMMQLIIEFAYTGSVSVTSDNALELFGVASYLSIMGIIEVYCNFLKDELYAEKCISIRQLCNLYYCPLLKQKTHQFILDNFEQVASTNELHLLSVEELCDYLDKDELIVKNESTVFEIIQRWITHAPEERNKHLVKLFSKVRLALLSSNYIDSLRQNKLVNTNAKCYRMVSNASKIIQRMSMHKPRLSAACNAVARPRFPKDVLLSSGGWSTNPISTIEAYDVRTKCWVRPNISLDQPRCYHGTVVMNGWIYCLGGTDNVTQFDSMYKFDLNTCTWHEAASMFYCRCFVSVTVLNGYIYALGGFDGSSRQRTAERYKPETNRWSLIAPMQQERSDASCTTLNNRVYICGGFNGVDWHQTCEYYNPETDQWTEIEPMSSKRSGIGVIAYADHIYAVGGFDGQIRLCSAEAYNPQTNTWHSLPPMLTPRSNFGIEVIDGHLFAVGGFNGYSTTSKVEYYDVDSDEWTEAGDMGIFRSGLSCIVVSGLPNVTDYIFPRDELPLLLEGKK